MAVEVKPKERQIQIDSPLGKDQLIATYFEGSEAISEHFGFHLELISPQLAIKPEDILGKSVTIQLMFPQSKQRYFNGIVVRFAPGPMWSRGNRRYTAELAPWTWLLTRTTDCRIFENKTAPDIVKEIFKDLGFSDFELNLKGNHPQREYCVQYRETDFNFVSRLLEEEGIFYFFKHEKGKHTLVLADQTSGYLDCKDKEATFSSNPDARDKITQWRNGYNYRPGKWMQRDYNFERPTDDLKTNKNTVINIPQNQKFELFDYPGLYTNKGDGNEVTKYRMEAEEAAFQAVEGEGNLSFFSPGYKFNLNDHECKDEQGNYVLTSVNHVATDYTHVSGEGPPAEYSNSFTCMPSKRVFRPARTTPKPIVYGPQTAVVTAPQGEEIDTDKYGRIHASFFWEREGKNSCWMRVAQSWASKQWGEVFIPRKGMEVVVHFLEGDPDRPLVTGCVYNADNMPPYALPGNKTQSGLKTRSTTNGTESNFNELRFEDKKGSEEVYFHAEKDFNRVVENNDTLKVGFDKKDKGDQTVEIFNNQTVKVGTPQASEGSQTIEIYKDRTQTLKTGNETLKVEMGNQSTTLSMGNQSTKLNLGASTHEAMQSIELKVGQSSVKIDQMGVTITGMMIKIDGQIQTQVNGLMTQVTGTAMLQLSGGITMIG